jgi:hypothetical protein
MEQQIITSLKFIIKHISESESEFNIQSFKRLKGVYSAKVIADKLKITEPMLGEFEIALSDYFNYKNDNLKNNIVSYRLILWIETISENIGIPFSIDKQISNQEIAIKQVRALELIIRDIVNENLGGSENVISKLKELFKLEIVDKWIKNADAENILSGTTFSELSNIFLDKNIFKGVQEIFQDSEFKLKGEERETLRKILEDIRLIRNKIAHNKKISQVQIEALNTFYLSITKLIDKSEKLNINSEKYLVISNENIEYFVDKLKEDNKRIIGTMESISASLEKGFSSLESKTDDIQKQLKTNWFSKKFIILYTSILVLIGVILVLFFILKSRPINTTLKLEWISKGATIDFSVVKEVKVTTKNFSKTYTLNRDGNIELIDIDVANLGEQLLIEFNDLNIVQIDTPIIEKSKIIPIRIKIKNLETVVFNIRDSETGSPIQGAEIIFSSFKGISDGTGRASFNIPIEKQSRFIDFLIMKEGYKTYKLNEVLVNSSLPIEVMLSK